jgi:hypothetical protein
MAFTVLLANCVPVLAQEVPAQEEEQAKPTVDRAQDELEEITGRVDQSEQAQKVRAGILKPIYSLAESFSFSSKGMNARCLANCGKVWEQVQYVNSAGHT